MASVERWSNEKPQTEGVALGEPARRDDWTFEGGGVPLEGGDTLGLVAANPNGI